MTRKGVGETPAGSEPSDARRPRLLPALALGGVSVVVIAGSAWLAVMPDAETRQTGLAQWFNDPPQPFAAVFAATSPLLRPVPLLVGSVLLLGWIVFGARPDVQRLGLLRLLVIAVTLSELIAQVIKRIAAQPRPLSVTPGLDAHGYPTDPYGYAYPSAHTAVVVAVATALWPWMRRPQRVVAVVVAALVAGNRLYIGAHWPIDVVGGAAIGLLAGSVCWLAATRWPLDQGTQP